jgi:hypothetical protein
MMNETETVKTLNEKFGVDLLLCEDEFSSYDAEDNNYIVEVKTRTKYYKDKLIEAVKLFSNFQKAEIKGKKFLYVLTDPKGFYVFNITNLMEDIIKNKLIPIRAAATTKFSNEKMVTKYSYLLSEDMAFIYKF